MTKSSEVENATTPKPETSSQKPETTTNQPETLKNPKAKLKRDLLKNYVKDVHPVADWNSAVKVRKVFCELGTLAT